MTVKPLYLERHTGVLRIGIAENDKISHFNHYITLLNHLIIGRHQFNCLKKKEMNRRIEFLKKNLTFLMFSFPDD